jgi:PKD repeat protein
MLALWLAGWTAGCSEDETTSPTPGGGNAAPVASFDLSAASVAVNVPLGVDASGSGDDQDIAGLEVRWDWEDDGTWDVAFTTVKSATHAYVTPGTRRIRLEVRDQGGLTGTTTATVEITENDPPTAAFVVAPTRGDTETLFEMDASGSSDAEDDPSELELRWDFEDDGTWDTDYQNARTSSHRYETGGRYTIRLEVRDSATATGTVTRQVTVATVAPAGMILVPVGTSVMGPKRWKVPTGGSRRGSIE